MTPTAASEVGRTLRAERLRQGRTVAGVAASTEASEGALYDLEEGRLPLEDARTRAYVRLYARHLELDAEELLRGLTPSASAGPGTASTAERAGRADRPRHVRKRRRLARPGRRTGLAALGFLAAVAAGAAVAVLAGGEGEPTVQLTAPPSPASSSRAAEVTRPVRTPAPPDPSPEPAPDAPPAAEQDAASPDDDAADRAGQDAPEGDEPQDDEPAGDEPAALPPEETQVQVLHGDVAPDVVDDVVATLEALGYEVPWVSRVAETFPRTAVFHHDGRAAEAQALIARDPRFGEAELTALYSPDPDLHVVVGPDWSPE